MRCNRASEGDQASNSTYAGRQRQRLRASLSHSRANVYLEGPPLRQSRTRTGIRRSARVGRHVRRNLGGGTGPRSRAQARRLRHLRAECHPTAGGHLCTHAGDRRAARQTAAGLRYPSARLFCVGTRRRDIHDPWRPRSGAVVHPRRPDGRMVTLGRHGGSQGRSRQYLPVLRCGPRRPWYYGELGQPRRL
jgi:hypothetical protein